MLAALIAGLLVALPLSAAAGPAPSANANVAAVRADVQTLQGRLNAALAPLKRQARTTSLRRVWLHQARLLQTLGGIAGAESRALAGFPPIFGRAYAQTFVQLDCVDGDLALAQTAAQELTQGRLARGKTYFNAFLAVRLNRARTCAGELARLLARTPAASQARTLQRFTASLAKRVGGRGGISTAALGRGAATVAGGVGALARKLPPVFGLPFLTTFRPLDCIDSALLGAGAVLHQSGQGRLVPLAGNPAAYPFQFVLASLVKAESCAKTLRRALAGVPSGPAGNPTAPVGSPTAGAGPGGGPVSPPAQAAGPANPPAATTPIYLDTRYSFAERAADLVSRLTLAEKVAQLRTNSAPAIPRLGIQQYTYWSEGQHGVNALGANTNHGGVTGGPHATSFPTNFAAAMTWDPQLMYQETTAISDEVRGFLDKSLWGTGQNNLGPSPADYGSLTFWAPTVNMDRDPRWGRTDEAFGEDPYLVSQMAGAFVDGYQGETITGQPMTPYLKVAATAKHFALNNVENGRESANSSVDDTDLHDYYTAQFRSLIEDAHVSGLMTSLNAINGTPAMVDTYTDNQVAQRTYGFDGYTTSDCALSNVYRTPPSGHDWAPPGWTTDGQDQGATWTNSSTGKTVSGAAGAQAFALRAGTDLNCPGSQATLANVQQAIDAGMLSEGVIDDAVTKVFTTRMETGEFDPSSQVPYTSTTKSVIQSPAHQALARQVADNSLVLLKNDAVGTTGAPLLPADPSNLSRVVILGDLANKVSLGGYSGSPSLEVSAVRGITNAVKAANPNAQVYYDAAGTSTTSTAPVSLSAQTQQQIQAADLVIVFVGTDAGVAAEGHDRSTIAMPGNYDSLISQVAAQGNPRMALVVQSDGAVTIDNVQSDFPAILFSGYNGESQGDALADVLFGQQNPSGHLDFTWYADDSQLPAMSNYGLTPASTGGLGRTYMYFTGSPTYPFGYGLSYTKFAFSNLQVSSSAVPADASVNVSFDVKNTGSVSGATVAQLYVGTPSSLGPSYAAKRLEDFQKTNVLAPGQTQTVNLTVPVSRLAFWDQAAAKWVVDDGIYQFQLAYDSGDVAQSAPIDVTGSLTPHVQYVTVQPPAVVYKPGDSLDLSGKNPWIADDTNQAVEQTERNTTITADHIVEAVNDDGSFVKLSSADVSYSSSNNNVATVSSSGVLTAVAPGVATISVTVNGVTGSAVIVVKQPLTVVTPAVVIPGSSFTASETLLNTGSSALSNANLSLSVPTGWTASPTSGTSFSSVPAGDSVQASWQVSVPSQAEPQTYELDGSSSAGTASGVADETEPADVAVPYDSLSAAFDNVGISDDSNPAPGNLDGGGRSYSAQGLASASPTALTPGATVTHDGLTFTWPNVPAGSPDNVAADGQAIPVSGTGSTLGFLGTGDFGTASGTGTIVYGDGSTQSFRLSLADWWANRAAPGGDILTTAPHVNLQSGQTSQHASVYYASVPLQAGKTAQYVILPPDVSQGGTSGHTQMHIFALGIG
jgi:beta-glucosidase-like glycosyl hydrolase